jgi:hypothetical protein
MPVYTLQGPDGRTYEIEGPAGATAEQLAQFVQSVPKEQLPKGYDPTEGMSGFDKAMAGMGKAVADAGLGLRQVGARLFGSQEDVKRLQQEVAERRAQDAPLMGTGAGMLGNVGGQVAMALLPGGVLRGAGSALAMAPNAGRIAQALQTAGTAIAAPSSIPGAAAVGAAQGALQPSISGQETATNAAIGGVSAAAIPTAVRAARVARALMDPFSDAGQQRIIGRAMSSAAGTPQDAATALQNMRNAQPLVPGSMPTAAMAAQNPGLAALERTATATDPVAMNAMVQRLAQNSTARSSALQGLAPDRAAAVNAREAATQALYGQANQAQIAMTPELQALMQRPSVTGAVERAQKLAAEQGATLGVTPTGMTGRDAHLVKMGLDDLANASPATGIGGNELRAIQSTRGDFLDEIGKQVPEYTQARQTYAQMSRPINQADVVEEIGKRATNFRGDMTPAAFTRAIDDKTAQAVTGQVNATMAGVMEPAQMQTLDAIRKDLLRQDFAQTAGRGVGSDTVQKLAYSNLMGSSGLPAWATALPRSIGVGGIAQRMGDLAYKSANEEMSARLAQALLDPQAAAALMQAGMVTPGMQRLVNGVTRSGVAASPAGAALLAPAMQALGLSYAPQQ